MRTGRDRVQSLGMGLTLPAILTVIFALGPTVEAAVGAPSQVAAAAGVRAPSADADLLAQVLIAPAGIADPALEIPSLRWVDPAAAEQAWRAIRGLPSPAAQAAAIRKGEVEQLACRDLVEFKEVARRTGADFLFRDAFRGRSWARPALARVLVRSLERFRSEFPSAAVSIGDITQPGCGQVAYGTLVQQLRGDAASDNAGETDSEAFRQQVRRQVRRVLGEPTVVEHATAGDFPLERDRFSDPLTPVLIEKRVLGQSALEPGEAGVPVLRMAVRRFAPEPLPSKPRRAQRQIKAMTKLVAHLLAEGELVRHEVVRTWDPQAGVERAAMLQHRVDRKRGRQLIVLATRPQIGEINLAEVVELRTAKWLPGKPETFRGETRWRPRRDSQGELLGWERWQVLGEAGHLSHDSGRDVDISFITKDNSGLHKVRLKPMDVAATWRWMQIVQETARELGTPVEQILVGKKVRGWLARKLPSEAKDSDLWRSVLQTVPGHDAHHHLRLAQPTASDDARALAELRGEPSRTAGR